MTRKDYAALARVVQAMHEVAPYNTLAYLIGTLSEELKADNPRFDHDRFWDACLDGYEKGNQ